MSLIGSEVAGLFRGGPESLPVWDFLGAHAWLALGPWPDHPAPPPWLQCYAHQTPLCALQAGGSIWAGSSLSHGVMAGSHLPSSYTCSPF